MNFIKECDEMLLDSELFLIWMERVPDFVDKLPENSRDDFMKVVELLDIFDKRDGETHELKMAAVYLENQKADTRKRREQVKKDKTQSRFNVKQLAQELSKPKEQVPEIEDSHRYGTGDSSFGGVADDNVVTLVDLEKIPVGKVRKSRRSVSASAARVVKKVVGMVRSTSHGRKPPTLFD